uniref:WD repeat domain 75 n=1 Tax=Macaca nemestrina TaxID=9545 RepID=A0A2K6BSQ3_MACNE
MVDEENIRVVRCGGSELNFRRAVFSADSKYIFCVSGDFVKVYSTVTEECVHILHGHRNLVTGIQLNPNNHLQSQPTWKLLIKDGFALPYTLIPKEIN